MSTSPEIASSGIGSEGDIVIAQALGNTGSTTHVENQQGRDVRLFQDDHFMGVLGHRHSGTSEYGELREKCKLVLFSGDTRGDAAALALELGIGFTKTPTSQDKVREAEKLRPEVCAAVGNGLIDLELIKRVRLGIVVLQGEGAHAKTLLAADIIVPSVNDALDLFLDEQRLIATLRE